MGRFRLPHAAQKAGGQDAGHFKPAFVSGHRFGVTGCDHGNSPSGGVANPPSLVIYAVRGVRAPFSITSLFTRRKNNGGTHRQHRGGPIQAVAFAVDYSLYAVLEA